MHASITNKQTHIILVKIIFSQIFYPNPFNVGVDLSICMRSVMGASGFLSTITIRRPLWKNAAFIICSPEIYTTKLLYSTIDIYVNIHTSNKLVSVEIREIVVFNPSLKCLCYKNK